MGTDLTYFLSSGTGPSRQRVELRTKTQQLDNALKCLSNLDTLQNHMPQSLLGGELLDVFSERLKQLLDVPAQTKGTDYGSRARSPSWTARDGAIRDSSFESDHMQRSPQSLHVPDIGKPDHSRGNVSHAVGVTGIGSQIMQSSVVSLVDELREYRWSNYDGQMPNATRGWSGPSSNGHMSSEMRGGESATSRPANRNLRGQPTNPSEQAPRARGPQDSGRNRHTANHVIGDGTPDFASRLNDFQEISRSPGKSGNIDGLSVNSGRNSYPNSELGIVPNEMTNRSWPEMTDDEIVRRIHTFADGKEIPSGHASQTIDANHPDSQGRVEADNIFRMAHEFASGQEIPSGHTSQTAIPNKADSPRNVERDNPFSIDAKGRSNTGTGSLDDLSRKLSTILRQQALQHGIDIT